MKLGTETNSMANYLMSGTRGQPAPKVGMGATILMWSDRHAATIVKVTPTQVHVQRDKATRIDSNGMSEAQHYAYEADSSAPVEVFRRSKTGAYKCNGSQLRIGTRDEYYDFSF